MINSPRLPIILLFALLSAVSAGCSASAGPAEREYREAVTPKAYIDDNSVDGPAYYGDYRQRYGLGSGFDPSGWSEAEIQAASYIHGPKIYFHFDSAALSDEAKAVLRQKAARIKAFPQLHILIAGHSDERGSDAYNLRLGERRAQAARDYLIGQGVPAAQLGTVSYGKRFPAAPGNGERSWSQNRRDEFMVSKP